MWNKYEILEYCALLNPFHPEIFKRNYLETEYKDNLYNNEVEFNSPKDKEINY